VELFFKAELLANSLFHAYPVVTQNELFPVTVQVGRLLNGQDDQAPIKLRNGLARIYWLWEPFS
jgi:hypothetical protein